MSWLLVGWAAGLVAEAWWSREPLQYHAHSLGQTHTHTHTHTLTDSGKHTHTHTHILTGQWEKDGERSSHSLTPALQSGGGSGPQVPPRDESTQALLPQGVSTQALTRPG